MIQHWKSIATDGVSDSLILTSIPHLLLTGTNGSNPTLYVRSPREADDREVIYTFPDDDPYVLSFGVMLTTDTLESSQLLSMLWNLLRETRL